MDGEVRAKQEARAEGQGEGIQFPIRKKTLGTSRQNVPAKTKQPQAPPVNPR